MLLIDRHVELGGRIVSEKGVDVVLDYGNAEIELDALANRVGVRDLSDRGRFCIVGADRIRFLHGQVTNDISKLGVWQGCLAALVSAKGRVQMDLTVFRLEEELLLDFESGYDEPVRSRLEAYIIADDVQVLDARPHYGLVTIQGPDSESCLGKVFPPGLIPADDLQVVKMEGGYEGVIYCARNPRLGRSGFDVFAPAGSMSVLFESIRASAAGLGGSVCGSRAWERLRVLRGIPRYGVDMDESSLAPETGLESRAISYSKGCYIGQEVIARIRTYGQVARSLRGLRILAGEMAASVGDTIHAEDGREVGRITSIALVPGGDGLAALGYVRKEQHSVGNRLTGRGRQGEYSIRIVSHPYEPVGNLSDANQ